MRVLISLTTGAVCLAMFLFVSADLILEPGEFARRGQAIEGRVVKLQPRDQRAVVYSYRVGARTYTGVGRAGTGNPIFERLSVGDPVAVVYLPDQPDQSILGDPESVAQGNIFYLVMGSLATFVLTTYAMYRGLNNTERRGLDALSPRRARRPPSSGR